MSAELGIISKQKNMPGIMDLYVLPKFRKKGIGTILIQKAEQSVFSQSKIKGIGDSVYSYAQSLYVKLSFLPDGHEISWKY